MLVRDFMTPNPAVLTPTGTLKEAACLFFRYRVNGAPVIDENGRVIGLVTNAHLVEAMLSELPFSTPIAQFMTKNIVTIPSNVSVEEACQIPVSRLPVTDGDNKLEGIMTRQNFSAAFQTALYRTRNAAETLIEVSFCGIIEINSSGIIIAWNEAMAGLTGISPEVAMGRHILDMPVNTGLLQVLSRGEKVLGRPVQLGGQSVICNSAPIYEGARVVGAVAVFQDMSELTQSNRQLTDLREEIELLSSLFEHTSRGLIAVDKNSIVLKVNAAYEEIMGISAKEAIGLPATEALENTRLHIVIQTGISELGEIQMQHGRQVIVNRIPLFDVSGKVIGAIGEAVFKDIKEISSLLERLRVRGYDLPGDLQLHAKYNTRVQSNSLDDIIGRSRAMVQVKNLAAKAAAADSNVMITGESGTGKDLFALAIHHASSRSRQPFVAVNCAAIPSELLESELFGYEEGAFTGAKKGGKQGKFEIAHQGTVFLDEIGDMPLSMQAKLLRVIEERKVEKVGGTAPLAVDVRIIAATNRQLLHLTEQGKFREDLYYRLNVINLYIPPLRERQEDIGELLVHIMNSVSNKTGQSAKQFAPDTLALLRQYAWPGNVRELINLIEQVMTTVNGPLIFPRHLPPLQWKRTQAVLAASAETGRPENGQDELLKIIEVLRRAKGNKALAAKLLGIHRSTLYEKMKKYDIH